MADLNDRLWVDSSPRIRRFFGRLAKVRVRLFEGGPCMDHGSCTEKNIV